MPYSPTKADATPVATDTISRLNTNPSPNLGATLKDALVALQDSMLCAVGEQLESNNTVTTNNAGVASYQDIAGSSITFTAPIAKTYTAHCDTAIEFSTLGSGGFLRILVNGSAGPDIFVQDSATGIHRNVHLMHSAACAAGVNTIKLQWKTNINTGVLAMSGDVCNYIISG